MTLKVFYIDDEEILCELFHFEFSSNLIQVMTFTDPQLAIEEAKVNLPDVVFVDYRMKGMTGDKVAYLLPKEIPKYLITGDIFLKNYYPFNAIFKKPIDENEIHALLNKLLLAD